MSDKDKITILKNALSTIWDELTIGATEEYFGEMVEKLEDSGLTIKIADELGLPYIKADIEEHEILAKVDSTDGF